MAGEQPVTDRSLFPHLAPDVEPKPKKPSCCEGLVAPVAVPAKVWTLVHALCHGRTPFTLEALALVADCSEHQARLAIRGAGQRDWLHPVWPEPYMTDPKPMWVGCLPNRR
jgi:hypothetical protein